jgi:hypothetical protein
VYGPKIPTQENDLRAGYAAAVDASPAADPVPASRDRLRAISPRSAQALVLRLVEGTPREACAAAYGIRPESWDVKLNRALAEYCARPPLEALPYAQEAADAQALGAALETGSPPGDARLAHLWRAAQPLQENGAAVRRALDAAAAADESSPARRREEWLRKAAILAIVALTAFFYLRAPP